MTLAVDGQGDRGDPAVVRRPTRSNTPLVRRTLDRLHHHGVSWAPRFLAIEPVDGVDHEILSWLPGAPIEDWTDRPDLLEALTGIVVELHRLTADGDGSTCLIHDDLQPRNVVVERERIGLIDWEQLRPGRSIEDVAQLCWSFVGPRPDEPVAPVAVRWRRILAVADRIDRTEVVTVAAATIARCIEDIDAGAAAGSERHIGFRDRGDHEDLRRVGEWLAVNGPALTAELS